MFVFRPDASHPDHDDETTDIGPRVACGRCQARKGEGLEGGEDHLPGFNTKGTWLMQW